MQSLLSVNVLRIMLGCCRRVGNLPFVFLSVARNAQS
jgi:hypothetical protein